MNIAVIFAGGKGQRLNDKKDSVPKQFLEINNVPVLIHTLRNFENHNLIDAIYLSIISEYRQHTIDLLKKYNIKKVKCVLDGGSSAQESIYIALDKAAKDNPSDSIVLIHDGVRPIVGKDVIINNIKGVIEHGSAITSTPCYETILVSTDAKTPSNVPLRKETFAAQAPQSFRLGDILDAHKKIRNTENGYKDIVDSCTLMHSLGFKTHLVEGNFGNIKITTVEDVYILRGILNYREDLNRYGFKNLAENIQDIFKESIQNV